MIHGHKTNSALLWIVVEISFRWNVESSVENVYRLCHRIFLSSSAYFHFPNFLPAREGKGQLLGKYLMLLQQEWMLFEGRVEGKSSHFGTNMHRMYILMFREKFPSERRGKLHKMLHTSECLLAVGWKMCFLTFHSARVSRSRLEKNQSTSTTRAVKLLWVTEKKLFIDWKIYRSEIGREMTSESSTIMLPHPESTNC